MPPSLAQIRVRYVKQINYGHCATAVLPCSIPAMLEVTMTVEKISISLDEETAKQARAAAEIEGMSLSAWLAKAAREAAQLLRARRAMEEYIQLFGEPDPEAAAEMDRKLEEAGYWEEETPEERAARLAALARIRGLTQERPERRAG